MNDANIQKAKDLMDRGWRTNQDHNFEEGDRLLNEAMALFEQEQDWFNVTECLNHLAYSKKMRSGILAQEGYDLAKQSLDLAREKGTKEVLANRAVLSLSDSLGIYEESLQYANTALDSFEDIADKADILSHIALIHLRTGEKEKAKETIAEAEELLKRTWDESKAPNIYVWQTRVLMTKAIIEYDLGNKEAAVGFAKEALKISQEKELKSRASVAEHLVNFLSSN